MDKILKLRAAEIRDEKKLYRNTSYRVGAFLYDLLTFVDKTYATQTGIDEIIQDFFTEKLANKTLFVNLGIVDETFSDGFADIITTGYYTYQKGYNEGEAVKGILIVSNVSYPGSTSLNQVKIELGRTYMRSFNIDERVWDEWTAADTYEYARAGGYAGTKKTFYKSLSQIDNLSFLKSVSYDDIDTAMIGGIYRVYDSDSITNDIMFVTYSSEHGLTKQTYINTNPNFPIPEFSYRTHDGERWSEWQEIGNKEQFKDFGIVPLSYFDNIGFATGIYVYRSEEDYAPGMLYVHYPASNTIGCEQDRFFKGRAYSRFYNKRTGEWTAWTETGGTTTLGGLKNVVDTVDDSVSGALFVKGAEGWGSVAPVASELTDYENMLVPVFHTVEKKWIFIPLGVTPPDPSGFPYVLPFKLK